VKLKSSVRQQLRGRHPQGFRDLAEAENGHVPFAPFDAPDEGAVQAAFVSQVGLRELAGAPEFADAVADLSQEMEVVAVHAGQ